MTATTRVPVRNLPCYGGLYDGQRLPWPAHDQAHPEPVDGQILRPAPVNGWRSVYRWSRRQGCWVCCYDERPQA